MIVLLSGGDTLDLKDERKEEEQQHGQSQNEGGREHEEDTNNHSHPCEESYPHDEKIFPKYVNRLHSLASVMKERIHQCIGN